MPTNLPPEYAKVEREFRAAKSVADKIELLQEMMSIIPKHKGTDHLRADLRRKLAKLKTSGQAKKGGAAHQSAFDVDKEGAGQIAVVGAPNAGKSALVAALTRATPEVSEAPYTTWRPTPGMMLIEDVQVQLVDTPPLSAHFVEPELFHLIRKADLILLVVDMQADPIQQLEDTADILQEQRIVPPHRRDRIEEQRRLAVIPMLVLANKCDDERSDEDCDVFRELLEEDWPLLPISAATGRNLERLRWAVFEKLEIMRIYSKAPGKPPDLTAPFAMKKGDTVGEFAGKVHQDFAANLKAARVWGSATYDGQMVKRDHILRDRDVVELRI